METVCHNPERSNQTLQFKLRHYRAKQKIDIREEVLKEYEP
jgi:hypothetical protein